MLNYNFYLDTLNLFFFFLNKSREKRFSQYSEINKRSNIVSFIMFNYYQNEPLLNHGHYNI